MNTEHYESDERLRFNEEGKIIPSDGDVVAAELEYARAHGKTAEQMQKLPDHEAAEVWRLAQAHALLRWRDREQERQQGEQGNNE